MLSNTSLNIISDMGITDHRLYDQWNRKWNRESLSSGMLFKQQVLLEVSYSAWDIYETEIVTSGLCYVEDLIFLENNVAWFWKFLHVHSADSVVELYNILSDSRFHF